MVPPSSAHNVIQRGETRYTEKPMKKKKKKE